MTERFMTTKEVAAFLRISVRTLYNYASQHEIYRPSRPGVWHVEHVTILEGVWSGALSEDQGLSLWHYRRMKIGDRIKGEPKGREVRIGRKKS